MYYAMFIDVHQDESCVEVTAVSSSAPSDKMELDEHLINVEYQPSKWVSNGYILLSYSDIHLSQPTTLCNQHDSSNLLRCRMSPVPLYAYKFWTLIDTHKFKSEVDPGSSRG